MSSLCHLNSLATVMSLNCLLYNSHFECMATKALAHLSASFFLRRLNSRFMVASRWALVWDA